MSVEKDHATGMVYPTEMDSKRSWYVCLGASLLVGISMGLTNSFGVLFVSLLDEFKESKRRTAWVGSLQLIWYFLLSPLTKILTRRFCFRRVVVAGNILFTLGIFSSSFAHELWILYLTYGLLFGTGTSLLFFTSVTVLPYCFQRHLAIACGIIIACNSLFTLWIGPVYEYLIRNYGWRMAGKILTSLAIPVGLGCALFPSERHVSVKEEKTSVHMKAASVTLRFLKNKAFLVWVLLTVLVYLGFYIPMVHLISFSEDIGISTDISVYSISCFCVFDAVGKVVFGTILDLFHWDIHAINSIAILTMAVSITLLPLASTVFHLFLFAGVYGFALGVQCLAVLIITPQLCQPDDSKHAITYLFAILSVPSGVGPGIAAWIYDRTLSYHLAFFVAGGFFAVASCLSVFLPLVIAKTRGSADNNTKEDVPPKERNPTQPLISNNVEYHQSQVQYQHSSFSSSVLTNSVP